MELPPRVLQTRLRGCWPSSSRSRFSWYLTYFRIFSASSPTVSTHYPFAQKWLPQYRFRLSSRNLLKTRIAVRPFRIPT